MLMIMLPYVIAMIALIGIVRKVDVPLVWQNPLKVSESDTLLQLKMIGRQKLQRLFSRHRRG